MSNITQVGVWYGSISAWPALLFSTLMITRNASWAPACWFPVLFSLIDTVMLHIVHICICDKCIRNEVYWRLWSQVLDQTPSVPSCSLPIELQHVNQRITSNSAVPCLCGSAHSHVPAPAGLTQRVHSVLTSSYLSAWTCQLFLSLFLSLSLLFLLSSVSEALITAGSSAACW